MPFWFLGVSRDLLSEKMSPVWRPLIVITLRRMFSSFSSTSRSPIPDATTTSMRLRSQIAWHISRRLNEPFKESPCPGFVITWRAIWRKRWEGQTIQNSSSIPMAKSSCCATGVLQSIKVRSNAPEKDKPGNPHYSKLQAKAEDELLKTGKGKLYLSFHLDPVYKVHWNNLVVPIEYEIQMEGETRVSPKSGKGPEVKAAADIDPREFLLNIEGGDSAKPLELTVRYFACNDD
jgi:hypothetical protein